MNLNMIALFSCLLLLSSVSATPNPSSSDVTSCCSTLHRKFPAETFSNIGTQSIQYGTILESYFSKTSRLQPNCFVQPTSAKQVAHIVPVLSKGKCKFAIKGGSALLVVGCNDITGGVTIDLSQLSNITLNANHSVVSIGAGAKWGDVYKYLNPLGLSVNGGRASNIGVSGFTLGGGLSLTTSRYGFGCDAVKNFQIVLGNGTLTNANAHHKADLFKALKGGLNNLGLVTRIDYYTFKTGSLWGGIGTYNFTDIDKFFQPIVDFTNNDADVGDGSVVIAWTNNATSGVTGIANSYIYTGNATGKQYFTSTDPSNSQKSIPAPLAPFAFNKVGKPNANSFRIASPYDITHELNGANNTRFVIGNIIFKCDVKIVAHVDRIAQEVLRPYLDRKEKAPYILGQIQYQPFPRLFTTQGLKKGENVLGTNRVQDNSILFLVLFQWDDPSQDQVLLDLMNKIFSKVTAYTKSIPGGFRDFQYAGQDNAYQDPIGSYGEININHLKAVSGKYDPNQVFQDLVPGGFKLGDAGKRYKQFNFNDFVD